MWLLRTLGVWAEFLFDRGWHYPCCQQRKLRVRNKLAWKQSFTCYHLRVHSHSSMYMFVLSDGKLLITVSSMGWVWMKASGIAWARRDPPERLWTWMRFRYRVALIICVLLLERPRWLMMELWYKPWWWGSLKQVFLKIPWGNIHTVNIRTSKWLLLALP